MFEMNLAQEFYIFLISINQGLIIGLIYDFYRVLRHNFKPKKLRTFIEDLVFWLIIIGIFFIFLFQNTDGIIRSYILIGFILGFSLYLKLISKYNFPLLNRIFQLILKGINEIIKIISYPFRGMKRFFRLKLSKWMSLPIDQLKDMKRYFKIIAKKK